MDVTEANELLDFLESNPTLQKYLAQAKSRYILYNVEEQEDNFPNYVSSLSERNNHSAFSYLTAGCYLAEQDNLKKALLPLKTAASLLEYNHHSNNYRTTISRYYLITCSLAYYAAFEYSKAFVVLNDVEYDTIAGNLLGLFLKKKFGKLLIAINEVLLNPNFSVEIINGQEVSEETDTKIYNFLLAKSLANLLEYFYSGDEEPLANCKEILTDLLELLEVDEEPSMWWSIRLFRIIVIGLDRSAVWKILPPLFPKKNYSEVSKFIKTLSLRKPVPIVELFISQREAISKALNPEGLVVCLPTSGGKTRIAEISIFQTLIQDDESIVVYIAPFRSLAFEVEQTLEVTFEKLGYGVSHLYGGSQFSKIDKMQIENSRILIATPEKTKAFIRADETIAKKIKLIVIDEGHLIGNDRRLIKNEMFFEELRHHIQENKGRFIVLSAVLPNASDIAEWLAQNKENVYANDWKPSTRRLGTLEYIGGNANINWLKEEPETWNYKFIKPLKNEEGTLFPNSKRQAVAAAAVKLSKNGSVLIFHARGKEINVQAEECITAMGDNPKDHQWKNPKAWRAFELTTMQSLGKDCVLLKYAQYGILCHQRKLPSNVKLSLERLMRQSNPKIIISTTTLAQGVNLGVSSVIIANIWFGRPGDDCLSKSKFWNIVGRAGRAFVDSEGKVLFAIDQSSNNRVRNKLEKETAHRYLTSENHDNAFSGLILMLRELEKIASNYKIDFELLLELITENYEEIDTQISEIEFNELQSKLDLIDDTLLALNEKKMSWQDEDSSAWIDSYFRKSLAFIQAEKEEEVDESDLIRYLTKRNNIVLKKAGDYTNWKGHINTGIPLRASLKLKKLLPEFEGLYKKFQESDKSFVAILEVLTEIEQQIYLLPGDDFKRKEKIGRSKITSEDRLNAKKLWLSGTPIIEIEKVLKKQKTSYFCNDFFTFTLPWAVNAVARKFDKFGKEDISDFYEHLAVLLETGVPNIEAAKIYLCGFRSRKVAVEIESKISFSKYEITLSEIREEILDFRQQLEPDLSDDSINWFELLEEEREIINYKKIKISNFVLDTPFEKLVPRMYNGKTYLCTPDLSHKIEFDYDPQILPFQEVVNKPGICFIKKDNVWHQN